MRVFAAAAFLLLPLLPGCASVRLPAEPTAVDHGLLLVRARVRGAVIPFTSDLADSAVVEQLDADGQPIPGKLAVSGAGHGGMAYFLDLPPGRYALVSVSFPARGVRYEVELSSAEMRREAVDLAPGKAAFLGALLVDGRFPDFDVAFDRALDVVGHWLTFFLHRPVLPRDADFRALDRTAAAERLALFDARRDLAATQWRDAVADRLREIGAAEPAATTGVLRSRELPLIPETFFAWRDTLKWGEPARAPQGLAWRRPGGEARVAVFFTSADAKGFAGYGEAVRQMRAAAGGLDDPDSVYAVRVGTRAGAGARLTSYAYPESTLVGSAVAVTTTETVLVDDPAGMFTARLRAPKAEFEKLEPAFREFLLQLVLGPPPPPAPKSDSDQP